MAPMLTTGLDGASIMTSASAIAATASGAAAGSLAPTQAEPYDVDHCGPRVAAFGSVCGKLAEAQQMLHPQQKARAADPTDQNGDLHSARQYRPTITR